MLDAPSASGIVRSCVRANEMSGRDQAPTSTSTSTCFNARVVSRLRTQQPSDASIARAADLCALLADPLRLRVLWMLRGGVEVCVCDVAHVLEVTVSTASHHLRRLRAAGIVTSRADGKWVHYSLAATSAGELAFDAIEAAGQ